MFTGTLTVPYETNSVAAGKRQLKTYALAVAKFYWQQFHDDEAVPRTSSSTVEIDVFLDLYNSSANSGGQKPGTDETDEKKGTKRKSLAL